MVGGFEEAIQENRKICNKYGKQTDL